MTVQRESKVFTLVFCVLGLYGSFLSWSLLQERINTKPYGLLNDDPVFFKAPLVVNTLQAFFAAVVGLVYSVVAHQQNPWAVFVSAEGGGWSIDHLRTFSMIALTSSLSSPLGYLSLKHVDYLTFLLAKSCKLLPVMVVHLLLYKTKFPPHKYMVAGLVTGGVVIFTLAKPGGKHSVNSSDGNTLLGIGQLLMSMFLDGLTNSTQDQLFRAKQSKQKLTGASLMCILNTFVGAMTLSYICAFCYETELLYCFRFFSAYPRAVFDVLAFGVLGAVGQVFVFLILEKFDSLILVTATVTRKMISMVLSVVLFGHSLASAQWVGIVMVFGGIGYESYVKMLAKGASKPKRE